MEVVMRQYTVININEIKPKDYPSLGIALMVMKNHNWECRSIIDGKLHMTRFIEEGTAVTDGTAEEIFNKSFEGSFPFKKKH
tara:strand:+ start:214 stop:459 length:246 start_codon:yes stop_codon:yes gene_type:complete